MTDNRSPIQRVIDMAQEAEMPGVLVMEASINAGYDKDRAEKLQNFLIEQKWNNGAELSAMIVMIASALSQLDQKHRSNFIVAMAALIVPMADELGEHFMGRKH